MRPSIGGYLCSSLRSAVIAANANPYSTVRLSHGVTYTLSIAPSGADDATTGDLNLTASTHINYGGVLCASNCSATIRGGPAWHDRLLTISDGVIQGNIVEITNVVFKGGNLSTGDGGGIKILGSSQVYLYSSVVTSNTAGAKGGGIALHDTGGFLYLSGSVVSLNHANSGGGISSAGSTEIFGSAIISNTAFEAGGYSAIGTGTRHAFNNTTLGGNLATLQIGGFEAIDGVHVFLNNVTVAHNESPGDTGGFESVSYAHLANTVLAGNTMNGAPARDCAGQIHSDGNNFIGNAQGCVIAVGNDDHFGGSANPLDARLSPLQSLAGTFAHVPLPASPLIDAGNSAGCLDDQGAALTSDQLGNLRPESPGGRCDIGAVEYAAPLAVYYYLYLPAILR